MYKYTQSFILFFVFLAITTINTLIPIIQALPVESITWVLIISFGLFHVFKGALLTKNTFSIILITSLVFIGLIIISDLANGHNLDIFYNEEFKHLSKFLIFLPFMFLFFKTYRDIKKLSLIYTMSYSILSIIFLYRFLILNEVRMFDGRPTINIRHGDPNFLSAFFTMSLPIAIMLYQMSISRLHKFIAGSSSLLFIICNFLTQSRAGIISMIFSMFFLLYFLDINSKIKKYVCISSIVIFSFFMINNDSLIKRYSSLNDKSNIDRISTYQNGLSLILENPFFGIGFHRAKEHYYKNTNLFKLDYNTPPLEIHNTYIEVIAELGILGFLPYLLLFSFLIFRIYINFKSSDNSLRLISTYSATSLISLILCSMIIGIAYKDLFILHLCLLLVLNLKFSQNIIEEQIETKR